MIRDTPRSLVDFLARTVHAHIILGYFPCPHNRPLSQAPGGSFTFRGSRGLPLVQRSPVRHHRPSPLDAAVASYWQRRFPGKPGRVIVVNRTPTARARKAA